MSVWAIVLACGKEQEITSGVDVAFLALGDRPVLAHSLLTLQENDLVDGIILVVKKQRVDNALQVIRSYGIKKIKSLVAGSGTRLSNLKKAAGQLPEDATAVLVHSASRPFIQDAVVSETVKAGKRYGAAVAAFRSPDAVKFAEKGQKVTKSMDRNSVWVTQSPQVFKRDVFSKMLKSGVKLVDDESALLDKSRQEIHLVVSSRTNLKIRTVADLEAAGALLGKI
ncbi:IspD/TarI family cytidylyltransferase [Tichowtungia aerotolerans]|uniref:NTP transferase domain-containing protein n=1 Tax=Tichowtungia aerotolerans TaxID=2697043 RepID=A0A6P1M2M1_9BACT|nr:2-C-methyl-D-erythritol 4-phosphate cytidylyltransferase [Tichowtungia aerotolerans]QHI68077.1 NTP transferase domain-containing protein [Tichowtungia aerotolerans]